MQDIKYIEIANKMASTEDIPSVLKRRYKIDTMPIRGLLPSNYGLDLKSQPIISRNC